MVSEHEPDPPTVFVTYSHDSPEHKELVRAFCTFLRVRAGVDIRLDQWADHGPRDWSSWALEQLREADFIMAIASPAYRLRAEGLAAPDEGRGAQFEAAIIRDRLTRDLAEETGRILPVVLPDATIDDLPAFLRPYAVTHYLVSEISLAGVEELLAALSRVAKHPAPKRGRFIGNPYAALHARLQAEEQAADPVPAARSNPVSGGIVFSGSTVTHHGDNVAGNKIVNLGTGVQCR